MSEQGKKPRGVARVLRAMDTSDGAGVSLKRSVGSPQLDMLDPFLMLDSISTDNAAGQGQDGYPALPEY